MIKASIVAISRNVQDNAVIKYFRKFIYSSVVGYVIP